MAPKLQTNELRQVLGSIGSNEEVYVKSGK